MDPAKPSASTSQKSQEVEKWQRLSSLAQLVMACLRDSIWMVTSEVRPKYGCLNVIEICSDPRALQPQDLASCKAHAQYIQRLGCETDVFEDHDRRGPLDPIWELSPTVYKLLFIHKVIPLPYLQSYTVRTEAEFAHLGYVVGPRTTNLEFVPLNYHQASAVPTFYNSLGSRALNQDFANAGYKPATMFNSYQTPQITSLPGTLRTLSVRGPRLPPVILDLISCFFKSMPDLEGLHLPSCKLLDEASFTSMLSLKTLQNLELGEMKEEYFAHIPSQSPQQLHRLQLDVQHLSNFILFLKAIGGDSSSKLQSINIGCNSSLPSAYDIKMFFTQLQSFHNLPDLHDIIICFYVEKTQKPSIIPELFLQNKTYVITTDTVQPLFKFENLQKIKICYQQNLETVRIFDHSFQNNKSSGWLWSKEWKVGKQVQKIGTSAIRMQRKI